MTTSRHLSFSFAAFASAAILLTSVATPAFAAPSPEEADSATSRSTAVVAPTTFGQSADVISPDSSPDDQTTDLTTQDEKVLAYWTPERLASAVPYEPSKTPTAEEAAGGDTPTGPEGSTPPAEPLKASPSVMRSETTILASDPSTGVAPQTTPVTNFPNTNGKLFFDGYGTGNAYCSASALNTGTKRVVITAGHCVYDDGAWKQNVVFVPNYDKRNADPDPVGIWTVHALRTFDVWINDGDLTHDVGMATLNNGGDDGQRIVDAVGGHGMYWNGSYAFDVSIFGYPSNKTNPEGRYTMWACWGATFRSGKRVSINGCAFGPGASGGPWLHEYNNASGLGYVRSVTSTWLPRTGQNWAPYFTDDMKALKDATNGDW